MKQTGTRAFTLIELLVVIGIIAVLIAIGLTVAPSLINSGRAQAAQSTLLALETVQQSLSADTDLRPKDYKDYIARDAGMEIPLPIADGRLGTEGVDRSDPAIPSLARFLRFAKESVPNVEQTWQQLDASFLRVSDIGSNEIDLVGDEVLDPWGNPFRFVHPSYDGGHGEWFDAEGRRQGRDEIDLPGGSSGQILKLRRSFRPYNPTTTTVANPIGDADEGIAPGGSGGYLYSAGPDGDPGTRADNVYGSVQPEFPDETDGQE